MGLVTNEELARSTGCTCHQIGPTQTPKDLMCFSPGIIGTLTDEQDVAFCSIGRVILTEDGIKRRTEKFRSASKRCSLEVKKYPKGERLIPRVECMKRELGK